MPRSDKQARASESEVASRQERAAGRLLDDEGLRGDLADQEFQPLLDWALMAADGLAASTASLNEKSATSRLDAGLADLKEIVRQAGAVVAAQSGPTAQQALADLDGALDASHLSPASTELARKRLSRIGSRLDTRRQTPRAELAESIAQALSPLAGRISGDSDGSIS
jgi:hypothetical protein